MQVYFITSNKSVLTVYYTGKTRLTGNKMNPHMQFHFITSKSTVLHMYILYYIIHVVVLLNHKYNILLF